LRALQKVNERLVVLAESLGADGDQHDNLNKITQLQVVEVIDLNELSNALKSVALLDETMTLYLVKQGDQFGQGIGDPADGPMVVVEKGRNYLGQAVAIVATSALKTRLTE
jgi:uncharacterized protein YacL